MLRKWRKESLQASSAILERAQEPSNNFRDLVNSSNVL